MEEVAERARWAPFELDRDLYARVLDVIKKFRWRPLDDLPHDTIVEFKDVIVVKILVSGAGHVTAYDYDGDLGWLRASGPWSHWMPMPGAHP